MRMWQLQHWSQSLKVEDHRGKSRRTFTQEKQLTCTRESTFSWRNLLVSTERKFRGTKTSSKEVSIRVNSIRDKTGRIECALSRWTGSSLTTSWLSRFKILRSQQSQSKRLSTTMMRKLKELILHLICTWLRQDGSLSASKGKWMMTSLEIRHHLGCQAGDTMLSWHSRVTRWQSFSTILCLRLVQPVTRLRISCLHRIGLLNLIKIDLVLQAIHVAIIGGHMIAGKAPKDTQCRLSIDAPSASQLSETLASTTMTPNCQLQAVNRLGHKQIWRSGSSSRLSLSKCMA